MPPSIGVPINGAELRLRRQLLGYDLKPFAKLVGISAQHLSFLERGDRFASTAKFSKICDVLGLATVEERRELVLPAGSRPNPRPAPKVKAAA